MKVFPIYRSVLSNVIIFLFGIFLMLACSDSKKRQKQKVPAPAVLQNIIESGKLTAVVDYNSTNYFVYRGKPMGFKYEMLHYLCDDLGVELNIVVSNNLKETFDGLKSGRFDVVAKNLTVTKTRDEQVDFTVPFDQTVQVVVQRQKKDVPDSVYVASALELAGKKVYVQKNTSYYKRLVNLSEEIGEGIEIAEDSIFGVEQLIALVAEGEIDYTVSDQNVAKLNKTYYPNLDVSLEISFPQNIAWAVREDASEWKAYLDNWITEFKGTRKYSQLYHKYFESPRSTQRMDSDFHSISGGKISKYDKTIKKLAAEHHWDWRLIASIIYHESRFNADAGSWAGAYGLMQLMPNTAEAFGVEDYQKPSQNIKAGILFLDWLNKQFMESIPDSTERMNFVLASYNIGLGHVKDAQRLAEKYGKNSTVWENNVEFYLKNKSVAKYYTDSVVRFGYARGQEATNYVQRVTSNYEHYLNVIGE